MVFLILVLINGLHNMGNLKTLEVTFNQGTAAPPKLGTVILKPTTEGKMSYSQNVTLANDLYGDGVVTPGPYINAYVSNLANPVYWKAVISQSVGGKNGQMWVGYNNGNTLDYLKGLNAGSSPSYENTGTVTLSVAGHTPVLNDIVMAQWQGASSEYIYATLKDTGSSDSYIFGFQSSGSINGPVALTSTTVGGVLPILKAQFDGNLYIGNSNIIDKVNVANATFASGVIKGAIGSAGIALPYEWNITALGEWNSLLVVAANSESPGDFSKRNGGGSSRIFFFDVANNPTGNFKTNFVNSPSHYISVLFTDLSGNLLAFGGVDEGRTTIYQYNGYGFLPLFSYIGDMPRNRHSVCYDAQGRLMWITANGQVCRLVTSQLIVPGQDEEQAGNFEHIGTIGTSGTGGILGNLQATGDDYVVSGNTNLSEIRFANGVFGGTGNIGDTTMTPIAISGLQSVPEKSIIRNVKVYLNKALQQGELLEARLYPQNYAGASYTFLGTLDFGQDGAIATKNVRTLQTGQDNFAIGIAWKTSNGTTTVPGLLKAEVDYNEITTL